MAVFRFMAEQLLLLIFIYSEVTVQALDAPNLAVSSTIITVTDHVTLTCEPPLVSVERCYFNIDGTPASFRGLQCGARTGHIWRAPSCQQSFTRTELLQRSQQSSPAVVDMKCYYTVQQGSVTSPWRDISSITLQAVMTEISTYTTPAGGFGEAATSVPALEGSSHNKITENFEKNQTWRLVAFTAVCLMTVSISLLGSALIYHQIRTGKNCVH
ncbi:uncharacterized protein LOC143005503 [Genypterus blacodes]|uniref:uncharacterized protein LOC143005503 n=1 Tax=Genypterus blacodes TaxID=154954 RepID=UPI003F75A78B